MSSFPPSAPARAAGTVTRGPAARGPAARGPGAWSRAAAPALALGLLTGCASSTASSDPMPVPGTVSTVPATSSPPVGATPGAAPSPTATRTPGSVTTVAPAPAEAPARTAEPLGSALPALERLTVAAAGTMSDYDRAALFGGWIDADGDCEDTRNEVLARDLTGITSEDGCTVATGTLEDPYTGSTIAFVRGVATSGDVQVDHVVSLGNAWVTGARRLSQADRVALANDPLNLLAVDGPANGSKSDHDASGWLPPHEAFACEMVAVQIAVKSRYGLWVTAPEKDAMAEVLATCPEQQLPEGTPFGDIPGGPAAESAPPAVPSPVPAPVQEAPVPAVPTDVHHRNCTAAREAGAAPLHRGDPGYREALDRDADGVACEG
ncbi:excalibur calcium-binding domain-containing protein [Kocuria sabuli]|uniref:excalibur calcium-binding domain-containing protein n=1 Tax=Kocuria sabuli TaxID=3071448 RepID=UPI0034D5EFB5